MKEELKIFIEAKSFVEKITEYSIYFPKREVIFKNKMIETSFSFLENLYIYNYKKEKLEILFKDISMLDYYIEYAYKKRILSHKINKELTNKLSLILKLLYGIRKKQVS